MALLERVSPVESGHEERDYCITVAVFLMI